MAETPVTSSGQVDFVNFAQQNGVNVVWNPQIGRLLVNNVPVNFGESGLTVSPEGNLMGDMNQYMNLISPFVGNVNNATKQDQIMNQMNEFQQYQTPEAYDQYLRSMIDRQQQPFKYDAETDPRLLAAREELENSVSKMAAERGFLYGSQQQDIVQAQMNKMVPLFEEMAYKKEQDFLNRQVQFADVLMQWDQLQYQRNMDTLEIMKTKADFISRLTQRELEKFKIMAETRNANLEFDLKKQRFDLEKQQSELAQAWKKVDAMGFVDNERSKILGVPAGTKAEWAEKSAREQKNRLDLMAKDYEYKLGLAKANAQIERELFKEEMKVKTESQLRLMAEEYKYDTRLAAVQAEYDVKIQKIREEIQAAKEAAAAAEAKAAAKASAEMDITDAEMKAEYTLTRNKLKAQFDMDNNGLIDEDEENNAAKFLIEMVEAGVSDATVNRLRAEYGIPIYKEPAKPATKAKTTPQQTLKGMISSSPIYSW